MVGLYIPALVVVCQVVDLSLPHNDPFETLQVTTVNTLKITSLCQLISLRVIGSRSMPELYQRLLDFVLSCRQPQTRDPRFNQLARVHLEQGFWISF